MPPALLTPVTGRRPRLIPAAPSAGAGAGGSLTQTLGALTVSSTAHASAVGSLAKTLAPLTLTASAATSTAGSLSATLGALTVTASAHASAVGSLAQTLGALSLDASAGVATVATLAATLDSLTLSSSAGPVAVGSLDATLGALSLACTATSGEPPEPSIITLLARRDDVVTLLADRGEDTATLRASRASVLSLEASQIMSAFNSIEFFRGEDKELDFVLPDDQDATGWDIIFTLATSRGGTAEVTKTATIVSATLFRVTLVAADTVDLAPTTYAFDVWDRRPGAYATLAHGPLKLKREAATYTPP